MTVRIERLSSRPLAGVPYGTPGPRGGIQEALLEVTTAHASGLPPEIDAVLVTADLQGRERTPPNVVPGRLLGELLAESVHTVMASDLELTPARVGVILGGDLYSRPSLDRRGGTGDVRPAWRAFAERFAWVAGVAGNHDVFGPGWSLPDLTAFKREPRIHLLDGDHVDLGNLRIAGLSGVVGNPRRPFRRTQSDFDAEVARLVETAPHILVLHDGPDVEGAHLMGMPSVRQILEGARPMLVVRGHAHWREPLAELRNGSQVLNVDGRAILLRKYP